MTPHAARVWRWLLHKRFLLFQRHRHNQVVLERIAGTPILVLPQVMNPVLFRTGKFLASTLSPALLPPQSTVLDMGTGSGICAVFAARWARQVIAVDLNPAAVRCAQINALLNQLDERITVCHGDLFAPVEGKRFDLVLFNPPYLRGTPRTDFERALWATDVVERFAARLPDFLTDHGCALVLLSTIGDETTYLRLFHDQGLQVEAVARQTLITEVLTIYRLRHTNLIRDHRG